MSRNSGRLSPALKNGLAGPVRHLMKERAYTEIKRAILGGELPSGSFLAERQLADMLAMSKTPVRAALERLAAEGFVTISPQQGIIVREMTVHEIADQYEIRAALEGYVLRSIAGKLVSEQKDRLHHNLDQMAEARDAHDVARAVTLDHEFHALFCEFLGNREILRVMGQLREKFQRVITKVFQIHAPRLAGSYAEHKGIAEAVIAGDGPRAARLIEEHLEYGKRALLSPRSA